MLSLYVDENQQSFLLNFDERESERFVLHVECEREGQRHGLKAIERHMQTKKVTFEQKKRLYIYNQKDKSENKHNHTLIYII